MKVDNPRIQALNKAGLTYEEVAKRLEITPDWCKRIFRNGNVSFYMARRLSRMLNCPMQTFL